MGRKSNKQKAEEAKALEEQMKANQIGAATTEDVSPANPKPRKRGKQEEFPMTGRGVEQVRDKKLDALADEFVEKRDTKAELAEEMTAIETKIIDRMTEIGLTVYRYADKEVTIKNGKVHAKVKQVKNEGVDNEE